MNPTPSASVVVDGLPWRVLQAEDAELAGPVIVTAAQSDRNAEGGAFVDFAGSGDQTVTWYVEIAESGVYGLDFFYALATGKADRPAALKIDGVAIETLTFEANSNAGETIWGPKSARIELEAGLRAISLTAPNANGANLDFLRITEAPLAAAPLSLVVIDASVASAVVFEVLGLAVGEALLFSAGDAAPTTVTPDADGRFVVDLSALSGDTSVSISAGGESAGASLFVPSADVEIVDGVAFAVFEAEDGEFSASSRVITSDMLDRGQRGDAFVDFIGPADETLSWTVTVAEDGLYSAALVYALASAVGARPMAIFVDGIEIDVLPFEPTGRSWADWGAQNVTLALTAGVHEIAVTAPGGVGPNVDYLRLAQAPSGPLPAANAAIEVVSLDPGFFDDRLHFNWIDEARNTPRDYKESGVVKITSTGDDPLVIVDALIDGPFELANPELLKGLVLTPGASFEAKVLFDRDAFTARANNVDGVVKGTLNLVSNAAAAPTISINLAAHWQRIDETGNEANVNEVWDVFGFGNRIADMPFGSNGERSSLAFYELFLPTNENEVMSPYWRIADGFEEARLTNIANYVNQTSMTLGIHEMGDRRNGITLTSVDATQNQRILPVKVDGDFATMRFTRDTIPDSWNGDEVFGIRVNSGSSDPLLNGARNNGAPTQAELDARFPGYTVNGNGVVFDPDGQMVSDRVNMRIFQAVDSNGDVIANTFLGIQDGAGGNDDYNDLMFLIEGVTPYLPDEMLVTQRIEAEDFTILRGFEARSLSAASEGRILQGQNNGEQRASWTFDGADGDYRLSLGYFDENDGQSQLSIKLNGSIIDQFVFSRSLGSSLPNAQTFATRTVGEVALERGDVIELAGFVDGAELLRIDYLELGFLDIV